MTIRPWMIQVALMAALCCFTAWLGWSACDTRWQIRDDERKLKQAATANQAWAERFTLQAQLATRDQQLAASQEDAAQKRIVVVVKKEIIYRDKIKDVAVRRNWSYHVLVMPIQHGLSDSHYRRNLQPVTSS